MANLRTLIAAALAENDSLIIRARRSDRGEFECTVQPRGWDGEDRFFAFNLTNSEYEVFEFAEIVSCERLSSGTKWTAPRGAAVFSSAASVVSAQPASQMEAARTTVDQRRGVAGGDGQAGAGPAMPVRSAAERRAPGTGSARRLLFAAAALAALFFVIRLISPGGGATTDSLQTATLGLSPKTSDAAYSSVCSARNVKCFEFANGVVRLYRLAGSPFALRTEPSFAADVVAETELTEVHAVLARNAAGSWLYVHLRDGHSVWVSAASVMADGDVDRLPVAEIPPTAIVIVDESVPFTATPIEPLSTETAPVRTATAPPTPVPTEESTATPELAEPNAQPSEEPPSFELDETAVARALATQAASGGVIETADTETDGDGATATPEPTATPPEATATPLVTPSPVARNCPRPEVCIEAPPSGAFRRYTDVYFLGTATHPNFQRYKFEAVNLASGAVGTVAEFWKPVPRGELMRFDPFSMPPGRYRFRMIVIDNTGNSWPEIAEVDIELQ